MVYPSAKALKRAGLNDSEISHVLNNREMSIKKRLEELDGMLAVLRAGKSARRSQRAILAHSDVKRSSRKGAPYQGEVDIDKIPNAVATLAKKGLEPNTKAVAETLGVKYQNLSYCLRKHARARRVFDQAVQKVA